VADLGLRANHDTLLTEDVGDQKMDSQAEWTPGQADNGHVAVTLANPCCPHGTLAVIFWILRLCL